MTQPFRTFLFEWLLIRQCSTFLYTHAVTLNNYFCREARVNMSGALDRICMRTTAVLADEVHRDVDLGSINFLYSTPVQ